MKRLAACILALAAGAALAAERPRIGLVLGGGGARGIGLPSPPSSGGWLPT